MNDILTNLMKLSVATITMQLLKRGIRRSAMKGVRPLNTPIKKIIGPAFTLRYIPAREDLSALDILNDPNYPPRVAIDEIPNDAVLVIDGRRNTNIAVLGDILIERLQVRGAAGLVTDGGIRDLDNCLASGFPIYAAGAASSASIMGHASGGYGCPIGCGDVAIIPGDIIIGDSDGVAVIPKTMASQIAADGLEQERFEKFAKSQITNGVAVIGTYPPNEKTRSEYQKWLDSGEPHL